MLNPIELALGFLFIATTLLASFIYFLGNSIRKELEKVLSENGEPDVEAEVNRIMTKTVFPPRFPRD